MEFTLTGLPLPLRITPSSPMSDADLMRFSAQNDLYPIERDENGDIIIMSPTGSDGSARTVEIILELGIWNRQTGYRGNVTEADGGYRLADGSVRAPDVAWTSSERLSSLSRKQLEGYAPICPQFIVELRSNSDRLTDLQEKMQIWMSNGAELAWLVDPFERAVTIYRPGREPERLDNISQVAGEGPVAGFVLPLDRIFT